MEDATLLSTADVAHPLFSVRYDLEADMGLLVEAAEDGNTEEGLLPPKLLIGS